MTVLAVQMALLDLLWYVFCAAGVLLFLLGFSALWRDYRKP